MRFHSKSVATLCLINIYTEPCLANLHNNYCPFSDSFFVSAWLATLAELSFWELQKVQYPIYASFTHHMTHRPTSEVFSPWLNFHEFSRVNFPTAKINFLSSENLMALEVIAKLLLTSTRARWTTWISFCGHGTYARVHVKISSRKIELLSQNIF